MNKELDNREKIFVAAYLVDLSPENAAIKAGYSKSVAQSKAYQWVSNSKIKPHVFEAVQKAMDKRSNKLEVTSERVLEEIAKLAFSNLQDFYNLDGTLKAIHELDRDVAACLSVNKINLTEASAIQEIKLHDKKGSLELLGRHLKLFNDKVIHEHKFSLEDILAGSYEEVEK